jgi:hypothetical protein
MTWAAEEAALRVYLDVPTGEDQNLELWLDCATLLADEYLERTDYVTVPSQVRVGVYELVKLLRLQWRRDFSAKKVQTDRLAEEYSEAIKQAPEWLQVADRFWRGETDQLWLKP